MLDFDKKKNICSDTDCGAFVVLVVTWLNSQSQYKCIIIWLNKHNSFVITVIIRLQGVAALWTRDEVGLC